MSISSKNLFFPTSHFSSKQSTGTRKRNVVPPWSEVQCHTLFHFPTRRRETIACSLVSHGANYKNMSKSPRWNEDQKKEHPIHCNHEVKEHRRESIEEHNEGKWALQPDLTVKRWVHFEGQPLSQEDKEDEPGYYYYYNTLHDAIIDGNLNAILGFLESSLEAAHTKITDRKETVVHIAITVPKNNPAFIDKLLAHIPQEALFSVNNGGETPLHYAAAHGNLEAAQLLVQKCHELPNLLDNHFQYPIHHAAKNGHRELVSYLMDMTPGLSRLKYEPKALLLNYLIQSNLCDEAVKLFNLQYEDSRPSKFQPERCQSFDFTGGSQVPSPMVVLSTTPQLFQRTPMRDKKDAKQTKKHTLELLKCFCLEISHINSKEALETVCRAALSAAKLGIPEVLEQLLSSFPAILAREETLLHIFHRAIQNRHANVFNLLFQMNHRKKLSGLVLDDHGNNVLHLTAKLPPQSGLNLHPCPALTMQRELQWFKAVEIITPPYASHSENKEKLTPASVFTEEHREMLKHAKDSMNNMAYSGTTVATLFTTMAFAAATAVPGGNNSSGYPIFSDTIAFAIFAISDAITLFLSIASTMMFFSFFTARYEEQDFLTALPRKLAIGLMTLFFSTISMMIKRTWIQRRSLHFLSNNVVFPAISQVEPLRLEQNTRRKTKENAKAQTKVGGCGPPYFFEDKMGVNCQAL
ncbi:hypothetical protein LUZ63_004006 [Rhynchospora breviuscula]|uniref:PGG domain-containing protein n=1 Tax=Rhynchospora breviuscula TaxID=2022672 RepID=A0A9Q0D2S5_9POAL|nr:hypothetical protein LUZ63_004006 [Rhynchospora breviuscula]